MTASVIAIVWRRLSPRGKLAVAALAILLLALPSVGGWRTSFGHWYDNWNGNRPLMQAKSWYYNLDKVDVDKIALADADVLVIDYAKRWPNAAHKR